MDFKYQGGIDLHIHSNASDGTHSPAEILHIAAQQGLEAISITDHDSTEGSRLALACQRSASLDFITGVEISSQAPSQFKINGSLQILGYGIDPEHKPLVQALEALRQARDKRTHQIVERLNRIGIALTVEQVMAEVGQATAGRPHVARALIKAGVAADVNDAFDRFIGHGAPAFVGKKRLPYEQTFELIIKAGGVPVLAHPYLVERESEQPLEKLVEQLSASGLKGIEVYYPDHNAEAVTRYLNIAKQFKLFVTGGTDFHGQLIPDIQMGRGRGDLYIPYAVFENLRSHQKNVNR